MGVLADRLAALASAAEEMPHPGPEIGPGQDGVEHQAGKHEYQG